MYQVFLITQVQLSQIDFQLVQAIKKATKRPIYLFIGLLPICAYERD